MVKSNLLVIGNPHSHISSKAFLGKFLNITYPFADQLFLVSGDIPENFHEKDNLTWFNPEFRGYENNHLVIKFFKYFLNQIKITNFLISIFRKNTIGLVIFLSPSPIVLLFVKSIRKRIIRYQGGITSSKCKLENLVEIIPQKLSDEIVVESQSCVNFLKLDQYDNKIKVSPLYVDTIFKCSKTLERRKDIGFVGSLNELKGAYNFSLSLSYLKHYLTVHNIKIVFVGEGPLEVKIKKTVEREDLKNKAVFFGWVEHPKLPMILNDLKLLVLPSNSEGLPNVVLEAMACGTPVLATPVGGIPDLIIDGVTGFLMEDNSPECIAKNITRALEHPELEKISENALKLVQNNFSYSISLKRWKKIIKKNIDQ